MPGLRLGLRQGNPTNRENQLDCTPVFPGNLCVRGDKPARGTFGRKSGKVWAPKLATEFPRSLESLQGFPYIFANADSRHLDIRWSEDQYMGIPIRSLLLAQAASAAHWKTITLITSATVAIVISLVATLLWGRLKKLLRDNIRFRLLFFFFDPLSALILSALASYYDVFKPSTYAVTATSSPDWHTAFWAGVWTFLATIYVIAKLAAVAHKEGEELQSKILEGEIAKERTAKELLQQQRDQLLKVGNLTRIAVAKKKERLLGAYKNDKLTFPDLMKTLGPQLQLNVIRDVIFDFFKKQHIWGDPHVLRMALYMHDPKRMGQLDIVMAWDGASDKCFSRKPEFEKYLSLISPDGTQSTVVQCYQSSGSEPTIIVIPDCEADVKAGLFTYWYPEQSQNLKSMVAYKHVFHDHSDAMVLMITSSKADFFKREQSDDICRFLDEMLTRFEMEWILLELSKRVS